jgi:hypothetical protein
MPATTNSVGTSAIELTGFDPADHIVGHAGANILRTPTPGSSSSN